MAKNRPYASAKLGSFGSAEGLPLLARTREVDAFVNPGVAAKRPHQAGDEDYGDQSLNPPKDVGVRREPWAAPLCPLFIGH